MEMKAGALRDNALQGKTYVITGGGTGLGRAIGTYLLQLGANLVITSRKLDVLNATALEMERETGGSVLAVASGVRHYDQVESLLDQSVGRVGRVDGLVNNAAGNFISPTERLSANAFSSTIDIVLKGTDHCSLAFGKHWIAEQQAASILYIVTTYAFTGTAYVVPSAAAKGGVVSLTRSLAVEWGPNGIRNNAIAPGPFPTKGAWERLLPDNLAEQFDFKKRNPLNRVGEHQELANLAAFLLSDFAGFINGEVITIDGGEWLQGAGQFSALKAVSPEMWDALEQKIRSAGKE